MMGEDHPRGTSVGEDSNIDQKFLAVTAASADSVSSKAVVCIRKAFVNTISLKLWHDVLNKECEKDMAIPINQNLKKMSVLEG